MSLTQGQVDYLHRLLETYYDAHSLDQKQDVIARMLEQMLPHHCPTRRTACCPEQLTRLQGVLLIRCIKRQHGIPDLPFMNLDRLWFDMRVIKRYVHFTHCLQVFHDQKRPPMHTAIMPHIMMLDFDHSDQDAIVEKLKSTNNRFHLYKTSKGWHAYCVSRFIEKRTMDVMHFMETMGCDPMYIAFAYRFGFMSRLSPKYPGDPVETWVGDVGDSPVIPSILEALKQRFDIIQAIV